MEYENKALIIHNLKDFDSGRTARHGTYNLQGKLEELDEVYRKSELFDEVIKISEECDNYMDFGDEIDAVIRSYKEDSQ